ncbi:MAG: UDP-N-acetylmuramoyl-L-alanyl-D-glutamate--2,6-diaminopimelate ligase [Lachnospiraceae bacterium]
MKLAELLPDLQFEVLNGSTDVEISDIVMDSRKIVRDCVFVAISGANFDGHDYVLNAASQGASAAIISKEINLTGVGDMTVIRVDDTRYAAALMSAAYFGYPARELFTIGITGTKGKTTTTYMVKNVLDACNIKTGLIGTIETIIGDEHTPSSNTTPEAYTINRAFRKMVDEGCKAVVMEVSSQGLMLHRTAGIMFDIGVFTNLEKDHIGPNEHTSMEHYIKCKGMLFKQCKIGIVNGDDEHTDKVTEGHTCSIETYGLKEGLDYRAENIEFFHEAGHIGTIYDAVGKVTEKIELSMPGIFSVYNSLCAVAITSHFNVQKDALKAALKNVRVKGRIEPVKVSDKFTLLIDYAHNAMSLESILKTLREYNPKRLVCVFGCGGNRSKDRRFEMGEVSGKYADFTIITSDNPRFEEPQDIIDDIKTGIGRTSGEYVEIINRKDAIKYAIENGREGDIIVLAGKGHEDYQEIKGVKYPMDERVLIKEVMEELCLQM